MEKPVLFTEEEMARATGQANLIDRIIAFEDGEMDEEQTIRFFQHLVDTGLAWKLQGAYGRTATSLIEAGLVVQSRAGRIAAAFQGEGSDCHTADRGGRG